MAKKITCAEKALRLISRKMLSSSQLSQKLFASGYDEDEIAITIENCKKKGFVDDELLASDTFAYQLSRGSGPRKIREKLRRKGLDSSCIDSCVEEFDIEEIKDSCRIALNSKLRVLKKDEPIFKLKDKCFRFLATRGFSPDVIFPIIDEVDWSSFNSEEFEI
jgi:regulatory protein